MARPPQLTDRVWSIGELIEKAMANVPEILGRRRKPTSLYGDRRRAERLGSASLLGSATFAASSATLSHACATASIFVFSSPVMFSASAAHSRARSRYSLTLTVPPDVPQAIRTEVAGKTL